MKSKAKSYTPEQLEKLNSGLPSTLRHSEGHARAIHQYSSATGAPKRKPGDRKPSQASQRQINNASTRETYQGQELHRDCVRPGAYDAIDAPSLRNGQRVSPQTPFCSP